jgi:3-isopropylmalate dehydrogenase
MRYLPLVTEKVRSTTGVHLIGVLPGEGIGPEVIGATLQVLSAVAARTAQRFELRHGGAIGHEAEAQCGQPLSAEIIGFAEKLFADGGVLLCGPGGGRFVYDLRRRFDLYCKLSPLVPLRELRGASRLRPEHLDGVDILVVRENTGGVYQGHGHIESSDGARTAHHAWSYTEAQVARIAKAAARIAARRRGNVAVVTKPAGVIAISQLFAEVTEAVCAAHDVRCRVLEIDHAAYHLLQHPRDLDVVLAPNLAGDVLADAGALLLGSRGLSFSGNFSTEGAAVYQTNHGAAKDLRGRDRCNPVAQFLSLAMLLRESFDLDDAAMRIEAAIRRVFAAGLRTDDVAEPGCTLAGTAELTRHVIREIEAAP